MTLSCRIDARTIDDLASAARRFDSAAHVPLLCASERIGWLRPSIAERLISWPGVFQREPVGISIADSLDSADARSAAVGRVISALCEEGVIAGWRDERYAVVTDFDAAPLLHVERAAARMLGITTYAAHANGYCGSGPACEMWVARRSETKPIDPGMLDNLVGGGMCAGVAPLDTIAREAWEEAGIPPEIAFRAVSARTVQILREVPEGVQSEVIFVHDLELPSDFEPHNMDGEVAEFRRVAAAELSSIIETGEMTLDASLVALSFLIRRDYLEIDRTMLADVLTF